MFGSRNSSLRKGSKISRKSIKSKPNPSNKFKIAFTHRTSSKLLSAKDAAQITTKDMVEHFSKVMGGQSTGTRQKSPLKNLYEYRKDEPTMTSSRKRISVFHKSALENMKTKTESGSGQVLKNSEINKNIDKF